MGKAVNYLREYREIKALEERRKTFKMFSGGVSFALFLTAYYGNITLFGILVPCICILTHASLTTFYYSRIKRRTRELGFDSLDDFRKCIDGTKECLDIKGVPDELMNEEQNRIIGDFVKGKKERKWKDVPEMFKGGGISIAPPTKFRLNGIMELALSEDDEEDEEINALESLKAERGTCD